MPAKRTHTEYEQLLFSKEIDIFPLENYVSDKIPILHTCVNNHQFKMAPRTVLKGHDCKLCSVIKRKRTAEEYLNLIDHKILEPYINSKTAIKHECSVCCTVWKARPNDVIQGSGCPSCAKTGFNINAPAILYYIKISDYNLTYYKVGITNRSVAKRFRLDSDKEITILKEQHYEIGSEAKNEETAILTRFNKERQHVPNWLKSGGNTELFEADILNLDVDFVS